MFVKRRIGCSSPKLIVAKRGPLDRSTGVVVAHLSLGHEIPTPNRYEGRCRAYALPVTLSWPAGAVVGGDFWWTCQPR